MNVWLMRRTRATDFLIVSDFGTNLLSLRRQSYETVSPMEILEDSHFSNINISQSQRVSCPFETL